MIRSRWQIRADLKNVAVKEPEQVEQISSWWSDDYQFFNDKPLIPTLHNSLWMRQNFALIMSLHGSGCPDMVDCVKPDRLKAVHSERK